MRYVGAGWADCAVVTDCSAQICNTPVSEGVGNRDSSSDGDGGSDRRGGNTRGGPFDITEID